MTTIINVQKRLKDLGFDPGPLDGIPGRQTQAAVQAFQHANGLPADGVAGPSTIAALFPGNPVTLPPSVGMPWLDLARRKINLHEGQNNTELSAFLRSDGKTLGDPSKNPWCGDFVETCIAVSLPTESLPANPYLARNWLKFGQPIQPTLGSIAVYWRESKEGTKGHVAFLVGQGSDDKGRDVYFNLGGNQSNAVTVAPLVKSRLLGCRWPMSVAPGPINLVSMHGGVLSVDEA